MKTKEWKIKVAVLWLCLVVAGTCPAKIIYVDDSAVAANNGTSWQDAYIYLQDALAEALSGDEVRVAQGMYRPDQSAYLDGLIEGDRDASFQLKNGVNLQGGYAGCGTPDPNVRDREIYRAILSGDLACNDPAVIDPNLYDMVYSFERRDNSIHVVVGTGTDSRAVLEGFMVMGGNANESGDDGWVSTDCGGGLYNGSGSCTVRECLFVYNSALYGGAVYNRDGSRSLFVNCTFSRNEYAGMYNDAQSSPTLEGCVFESNQWCGMANCEQSNPILTDCRICRNRADSERGGGIFNVGGSCPVLNGCVFEENFTGQRGGALYCRDSSNAVATDCVFQSNRATWYGGAVFSEWSQPVFRRCVFEDNESNSGGAIGIGNWDWYDGAFSDVSIENCLFALNQAGTQGGAISVEISHQNRLTIINCTFADNAATIGRAILCDSFMHNYVSEVTVTNCILWDGGGEVSVLDRSNVAVRYSDVQGGWTGDGNLDRDPMFANPDAGDYHLKSGSPGIDKGDNSAVPEGALDLDSNARIRGKAVDMGAYEYQYSVGAIIYVDKNAIGANNGTSWEDAFNYLQLATLRASCGDEIRVAQGVYKPHEGVYWDVTDVRSLTFQLVNGVTIKGGYAGFAAAEPDARNTKIFETILSGDLNGDDGLEFANNDDNSFHIVTASWTAPSAVLDGFVITGGNASHETVWEDMGGGGFYCDQASPTITDCTFRSNYAGNNDGGGRGGAVCSTQGAPSFDRCRFIGNCAIALDGGEGYGGAMFFENSISSLNDCVFSENTSGHDGGAIFFNDTNLTVINSLFSGNFARLGGTGSHGGAICTWAGYLMILNCTFSGNTVRSDLSEPWTEYGGALFIGESTNLTLFSSILWGNSAHHGSQIAINSYGIGSIDIRYNDVQGGYEGTGNIDIDPLFADADNGDYHLKSQAGRLDPNDRRWTIDEVTSLCIDAGDPMSAIGYEPFPNGGIINMGAYGGTVEASKSYFGKPPCEIIVAGDINGDCAVDFKDFAIMALHWLDDYNQ